MKLSATAAVVGFAAVTASGQMKSASNPMPQTASAENAYGKLPLIFEKNQGQSNRQVKFISRSQGYVSFLTSTGMTLALEPRNAVPQGGSPATSEPLGDESASVLKFALVGGAKDTVIQGEGALGGRINYFLGNNSAKWQRNIKTFSRVRYKKVYPGIDLVYYGNQRRLEYDFEIGAGSDPNRIQLAVQGAKQINVDDQGDLVLSTKSGDLHFNHPTVYQVVNGQRVEVRGGYVLSDATHISFRVANYNSSKALVIDPVLEYSTYLGGSGTDQSTGIAVDASGNAYVTGYTNSPDFPITSASKALAGRNHVFLAKLDRTGENLIYMDYMGGDGEEYSTGIALDRANNAYLTGGTRSTNFPTINPFQTQYV